MEAAGSAVEQHVAVPRIKGKQVLVPVKSLLIKSGLEEVFRIEEDPFEFLGILGTDCRRQTQEQD